MKKKILGIIAVVVVIFINLYLTSSDNTIERLTLLQDVESLANEEPDNNNYYCPSLSFEGRELYSYLCSDGISFHSECVDVPDLMQEKCCLPEEETICPVGTTIDPTIIVAGNAAIIESKCSLMGHIFTVTLCRNTCKNCGIVYNTCLD